MDSKANSEVLSVFQAEYCRPSGIAVEDFLKHLQIPPLNTVLRADRIPCDRQAETIRDGLFHENRDRMLADCLSVTRIRELGDVWVIKNVCNMPGQPGSPCGCLLANSDVNRNQTDVPPEVVVDAAAGESCLRGAHIYAQGIMGCPAELRKGARVRIVSACGSSLQLTILYWRPEMPDRCQSSVISVDPYLLYFFFLTLIKLDFIIAQRSFRANSFPSGIGIYVNRPLYPLLSLNEFLRANRRFSAQNLPSCVAVQVLNPQPEEVVLDCCAAPGGKTLHIANLMHYRGRLVATDKSRQRAEELKKLCCDLDGFVEVYPADATSMLADSFRNDATASGPPPYPAEMFDRILVDAPCSGSGLRPRLSLKSLHLKQICSCPRNQKAILKGTIPLLKRGGTLVYSTCSVLQRENEDVVSWTLEEFPNLKLTGQTPHLGKCGFLVDGLSIEQSRLLQRFSVVPEENGLDTIGFFIAKFTKL
ncbi:tRNA (cytosine(72)-C(5))-methyltransferase NSUN6-like [Paramacrobiotus metropolitanus]|uniref:tRNA (cytosine(72)-C(5))-methyltransferase NSUN6-like n=1 Tax=Paramacrobiotus metropolitanus TaxID=2943436 RepID=UPI0024459152|nr:tRNA (cytosine(72)-C(5))-methyltransferase NSUN6-like [Paramacrobiotus metropolitanus]